MQKFILTLGIVLTIIGLIFPYISKLSLFKLPGDIYFGTKNLRFFFPITTSVLLSAFTSIVLWIWRKL